ncbi:MAG: hypothetical protein R2779_02880 [Crocinitomicaceae bacterium]
MKKQPKTIILSLTVIIAVVMLGNAYKFKYKQDRVFVNRIGNRRFTGFDSVAS